MSLCQGRMSVMLGVCALTVSASVDIGHHEVTFKQISEGPCHGTFGKILHSCGGPDGCDGVETDPYKQCANSNDCAGFFYGYKKDSPAQVKYWLMKAIDYSESNVLYNEYRFSNIEGINCYAKQDNIVIKKNHDDWGLPMTAEPTRSPTHMPIVSWENTEKRGRGTQMTTKKLRGQPTLKPTAAPAAKQHVTCKNGDENVPDGWVGAGKGSNYCNLCKCMELGLYCTMRQCDLPLPTRRNDREVCQHTTCKYDFRQNRVKVQHHHQEMHENVNCAYDRHHDKCMCMCHNKFVSYAHTQSFGYKFKVQDKLNTECRIVKFAQKFDPHHETNVVVTSAALNKKSKGEQPLIWVERSWSTGFKMCATAQGAGSLLPSFEVNVYAFQSTNKDNYGRQPFTGSRAGDATVVVDWGPSQSRCGTVKFSTPFKEPAVPFIVGSVNLNSLKKYQGDALASWIEDENSAGFKVCFSQAKHSSAAEKDYSVHFTYLAVQQSSPVYESRHGAHPYLEASSEKAKPFNPRTFTTCKDISFPYAYEFKPTVLVSPRLSTSSKYSSMYSNSVGLHTYITATHQSYFTVCSSVIKSQRADLGEKWVSDTKLAWDYFLLPRDAQESAKAETSL